MNTQMDTKLRLVRCPRCRKILPEWPQISVYKCGGCGAILQAKNWKNDINRTEFVSQGTNPLPKNKNESVSDRLNQEVTVPFLESSPVSDNKGDQSEIGNHNTDNRNDSIFSDKLPGSTKLCSHRNDNLCLEVKKSDEQGKHKSSVGHDARKYGSMSLDINNDPSRERNSFDELHCSYVPSFHENDDASQQIKEPLKHDENRGLLMNTGAFVNDCQGACSSEGTGGRKFSAELATLTQLTCHKAESSSLGGSRCDHLAMGNDLLKPPYVKDQDEGGDHRGENLEKNAFVAKVPLLSEGVHYRSELSGRSLDTEVVESRYLPEQSKDKSPHKYTGEIGVSSGDASFSREASSSAVVALVEVEMPSMEVKAHTDVDENQMSNFKSLDVEGSLSAKKVKSVVAAQSPSSESMLSENLSPDNKRLQQSCNEVQGIGRVSSIDTLESLVSPRLGSLSGSYYVCDASVSSYEGMDDQFSDQNSDLKDRKFKATSFLNTIKLDRNDGFGVQKTQSGELEMHHQPIGSSSISKSKNTNGITGVDQGVVDEFPGARSYDRSVRSRTQWDKHVSGSRMTYISRSSQFVHGNAIPSNYQHNMFQQNSGYSPPDTTSSYSEPDNVQLLTMVYELEDKLKQTHIPKQAKYSMLSPGHLGKEKHSSIYYDDIEAEEHPYADVRFSRYPGHLSPGMGWPQHPKISRMNFSGEAAQYRYQIDCLCSHCCRKNWHCSTQLPSHSIPCSDYQCMGHPSHSGHYGFPSSSWSPQSEMSSDSASWIRETEANNGMYMGRELNGLYVEKHNVAKRHVMPVAAGSPIIACSCCSELLQLPVDFLVFKRCNQLRCNSCQRILKYSLSKGHLVPYS